jgi:hypothetical protein
MQGIVYEPDRCILIDGTLEFKSGQDVGVFVLYSDCGRLQAP